MTVFTIDPRQKKIVDLYGRPIGLPINDFGSRSEIEFTGFTYSSSLSIALYLIRPDYRDGQTMPVYYGTAWTESNGVYKHEMKYGKDYYDSVTQNDSLARLVLVADSVVVLDQEVQIDMIFSYSEDAERLPVGPDGYATESYVNNAVSGKADKSELEAYQEKLTAENKLDYALLSGAFPYDPVNVTLEMKTATVAGTFTGSFEGKQIQKWVYTDATSGIVSIDYASFTSAETGIAPTVEYHVPTNGNVSTIMLPAGLSIVEVPDSLTYNGQTASDIDYHVFVLRAERDMNGAWKFYINYAYDYIETIA